MNATVHRGMKGKQLVPIAGQPPDLTRLPGGCSFAPRCPVGQTRCHETFPEEYRIAADHMARCFLLRNADGGWRGTESMMSRHGRPFAKYRREPMAMAVWRTSVGVEGALRCGAILSDASASVFPPCSG